jgi:hypothetical protein
MRVNTAGQNFCSFEMTVGTDNVALFFPISCADKLEETVKQLNDAVSPARSGNKGAP